MTQKITKKAIQKKSKKPVKILEKQKWEYSDHTKGQNTVHGTEKRKKSVEKY